MEFLTYYAFGGMPLYFLLIVHLWRNLWNVTTEDFFGILVFSFIPFGRELMVIALMVTNNRKNHGGIVFKRYE